ncbi:MAG: tetratricopeptide repeat protein [Methanomassiliicoccaceae archaeon]|nr:tetratricopeptide repeat protein [Methanomassiliicoccaceae archaeon]
MKGPEQEAVSKAKRQAESGNPAGAVATLEAFLEGDPHNARARMQLARTLAFDMKDVDAGVRQLNVVLDLEPGNVEAMKAMVTLLAKHKRNNKETVRIYGELLRAAPDAALYNAYAMFLRIQMTDFKGSAEYYEKAISLNPAEPMYRRNYAVLLLNDLKDYERARDELEALLRLDPGDIPAKRNYDLLMEKKFDSDGRLKKRALFRR